MTRKKKEVKGKAKAQENSAAEERNQREWQSPDINQVSILSKGRWRRGSWRRDQGKPHAWEELIRSLATLPWPMSTQKMMNKKWALLFSLLFVFLTNILNLILCINVRTQLLSWLGKDGFELNRLWCVKLLRALFCWELWYVMVLRWLTLLR